VVVANSARSRSRAVCWSFSTATPSALGRDDARSVGIGATAQASAPSRRWKTSLCVCESPMAAEHAWYEGPASLWDPMPILTIRHVTSYHYRQPVAFGEHRMMLRPRDDGDQRVLVSDIDISPQPSELAWTQDHFGNHVAIARFEHRANELRFESSICVDHVPAGFLADDIADYARSYPFAYAADDKTDLAALHRPRAAGAPRRVLGGKLSARGRDR